MDREKTIETKDRKKTLVILTLLIFLVTFLKFGVFAHIGVNITESVYFRVYSYDDRDASKPLKKDQYIIFEYDGDDERFVKKGTRVVKRVGCVAGQTVTFDDRFYYCDNLFMADRKPVVSKKYGSIPFDNFTGVVPTDKIYLVGEHERSFDSRFFGVIDDHQIAYTVYPIF